MCYFIYKDFEKQVMLMNKYMKRADELASENLMTNDGGPFGACIVRNGKIIGEGRNTVLRDNDPTAHAEVNAIRNACSKLGTHDLSGAAVYTSCYPCPMCMSALIWANIKTIYYGNTKEDADDIGFRDDFIYNFFADLKDGTTSEDQPQLIPMDRDLTLKTFEDYKAKEDKTLY